MDIRERIKNVMIAALNEAKITAADVLKNRAEGLAKIHGAKGTKRTQPSFDPEVVKKTPIKPISQDRVDRGHQGTRQDRGAARRKGKLSVEDMTARVAAAHIAAGGSGKFQGSGKGKDLPPKDPSIGDH